VIELQSSTGNAVDLGRVNRRAPVVRQLQKDLWIPYLWGAEFYYSLVCITHRNLQKVALVHGRTHKNLGAIVVNLTGSMVQSISRNSDS
jgi:hypothetical protein